MNWTYEDSPSAVFPVYQLSPGQFAEAIRDDNAELINRCYNTAEQALEALERERATLLVPLQAGYEVYRAVEETTKLILYRAKTGIAIQAVPMVKCACGREMPSGREKCAPCRWGMSEDKPVAGQGKPDKLQNVNT